MIYHRLNRTPRIVVELLLVVALAMAALQSGGCRSWFTPARAPSVGEWKDLGPPVDHDGSDAEGNVQEAARFLKWVAGGLFVFTLVGSIAIIALAKTVPFLATVPLNLMFATGIASLACFAAQLFLLMYGLMLVKVLSWITLGVVGVTVLTMLIVWGRRLYLYVTGKRQAGNGRRDEGIRKLQAATANPFAGPRAQKKLEAIWGTRGATA